MINCTLCRPSCDGVFTNFRYLQCICIGCEKQTGQAVQRRVGDLLNIEDFIGGLHNYIIYHQLSSMKQSRALALASLLDVMSLAFPVLIVKSVAKQTLICQE